MRKYFELLNNDQLDFITSELGMTRNKLFSMNSEEADALYDELGLIEADEIVLAGDAPLSYRGNMAADIVTTLGKALAEDMGWIEKV